MEDMRFGTVIRVVRIKRGWRQIDLARAANVSPATISRLERGHLDDLAVKTVRRIGRALDVRVDLTPRWRAGELDRLLSASHSQLHEALAQWFADELPAWVLRPEVSFAVYGERGVIDILAWHAGRRALLVIELKTDIVDVNDLVGGVDRKRRLAVGVARELGWPAAHVSVWVVVADGRTNRRRILVHGAMLKAAFPTRGHQVVAWLRDPASSVAALSTWSRGVSPGVGVRKTPVRRVRQRCA
jgi:transcriptional regulator with XRE-family HTH domain